MSTASAASCGHRRAAPRTSPGTPRASGRGRRRRTRPRRRWRPWHWEAAGAVIDAGGGASLLAQRLTNAGFTDVTVLDVSAAAMAAGRARPGSSRIRWVNADLLGWKPPRAYQIWHDRAVFHFLVSPADRAAYLATMRAALSGGGAVILAAFAADGPEYCSGLPVARHDPAGLAAELTAAYGDAASWRPGCR